MGQGTGITQLNIDSTFITLSQNERQIHVQVHDVVGYPGYSGQGTVSLDSRPIFVAYSAISLVDDVHSHVRSTELEGYSPDQPFPLSQVSHLLIQQIVDLAMC